MKSKNNIKITIGIPAYNEEKNISKILFDILNQKLNGFEIVKVIVVSDGSIDNTVNLVKSIKDDRIVIFSNEIRKGKAYSQNIIFKESNSDYLLMLDADTRIYQNSFVQMMAEFAFNSSKFDLTCSKVVPQKNLIFFEKVLGYVQMFKDELFEKMYKLQKPLLVCNGRAMLYSKRLYKKIKLPVEVIADDAFVGLFCIRDNYKIGYQNKACVYFKLPHNVNDHYKQNKRFKDGRIQINQYFENRIIKESYSINFSVFAKTFIKWMFKNIVYMFSYCCVMLYLKFKYIFSKSEFTSLWDISKSSK